MTKSKAKKAEPKAKAKQVYILIGRRHTRSRPDGTREVFVAGDEIDPTPSELAAFPDKIVTAETFRMMASQHEQERQNKAALAEAKQAADALALPGGEKEQDPEAVERGNVLDEIRKRRQEGALRM